MHQRQPSSPCIRTSSYQQSAHRTTAQLLHRQLSFCSFWVGGEIKVKLRIRTETFSSTLRCLCPCLPQDGSKSRAYVKKRKSIRSLLWWARMSGWPAWSSAEHRTCVGNTLLRTGWEGVKDRRRAHLLYKNMPSNEAGWRKPLCTFKAFFRE